MNHVITAEIQLNTLGPDGPEGLRFTLVFTHQPTTTDIMLGYDNTPSLYKREDYKNYRARLLHALNTYGVPKLDMMRIVDPKGEAVQANVMCAKWYANLEGTNHSEAEFPIGHIVVSRRVLFYNDPEATAVAAKSKPSKPVSKPKKEKK